MKRKRKSHGGAFKAKVGWEALLGVTTVGQTTPEYEVRPTLVTPWKGVIRDRLPERFEPGSRTSKNTDPLMAPLHQEIGELTVDLDRLKSKSRQLSCRGSGELDRAMRATEPPAPVRAAGVARSGY